MRWIESSQGRKEARSESRTGWWMRKTNYDPKDRKYDKTVMVTRDWRAEGSRVDIVTLPALTSTISKGQRGDQAGSHERFLGVRVQQKDRTITRVNKRPLKMPHSHQTTHKYAQNLTNFPY